MLKPWTMDTRSVKRLKKKLLLRISRSSIFFLSINQIETMCDQQEREYLKKLLLTGCFPTSKLLSLLLYLILQLNLKNEKIIHDFLSCTWPLCWKSCNPSKMITLRNTFCALINCISSCKRFAASSLLCFCFISWTWFSCFFLKSEICNINKKDLDMVNFSYRLLETLSVTLTPNCVFSLYIYIYIYLHVCVCVCACVCLGENIHLCLKHFQFLQINFLHLLSLSISCVSKALNLCQQTVSLLLLIFIR